MKREYKIAFAFAQLWALLAALASSAVIEFTQDNCPPCERMRPIVAELRRAGYEIDEINLSHDDDPRSGDGRTPQFVVVDARGGVIARRVGACDYQTLKAFIDQASGVKTIDQAICLVRPPAAVVRVGNTINGQTNLGSGTYVDGGIITCDHIFTDGVGDLAVKFPGYDNTEAKLIARDEADDLALLSCEVPRNVRPIPVAFNAPRQGDRVRSAGFGPPPREYLINNGVARQYVRISDVVSGRKVKQDGFYALEISGSARQGDSGGPMFNARGELVAVISGTDGQTVVGSCCLRIRALLDRCRNQGTWRPKRDDDETKAPEADQPPVVAIDKQGGCKCGPDCKCKADEIGKLESDLGAATVERRSLLDRLADLKTRLTEAENKPAEIKEIIKEKLVEKVVPAAETWLSAKALTIAAGFGVPGWLAAGGLWIAKRRVHKRLKQWEGGDLSSAASGLQQERDGLIAKLKSAREELHAARGELQARPTIERVVEVPAPPAPVVVDERHHNLFSTVPVNPEGRAWARAIQVYVDKFPGAERTLRAVTKLKDQILAGEPTSDNL